ncbi:hypothetical protein GW17_00014626 [Ensete ventricosum]|nr:hypothetical protein GW17_00014626 [Ensete ventricosum]
MISTCSLQDTSGSVKLWEITRGVVIEDYGKVLFYTSWKCLFSGTRGLEEYLSCFILCRCSFHLQACEGSSVQILTQGKLSAPRILRINKVKFNEVTSNKHYTPSLLMYTFSSPFGLIFEYFQLLSSCLGVFVSRIMVMFSSYIGVSTVGLILVE